MKNKKWELVKQRLTRKNLQNEIGLMIFKWRYAEPGDEYWESSYELAGKILKFMEKKK